MTNNFRTKASWKLSEGLLLWKYIEKLTKKRVV